MADIEKSSPFKPKKWRTLLPALVASHGTLALGTILGWTSPALPTLTLADGKDDPSFGQVTADQKSWIASLALLGALLSAIPGGCAVAKFGGRKCLMLFSPAVILAWLQIIFANSIRMFYFGRFMLGFAAGPYLLAVPVYIAGISSDKLRAHLSGLTMVQLVHGVVFAYIKGALANWLWLSVSMAGIPGILLIGMYFLPEDPVRLLQVGKEEEATKALKWLRGAVTVDQIEPELKKLKAAQMDLLLDSTDSTHKMRCGDWFSLPTRTSLIVCCILMVIQQWSGIGLVIMYTVQTFQLAALTAPEHKLPLSANLATILVGFAQVIGVTVSAILIKKFGHKIPLILSCLGTTIFSCLIGTFFFFMVQNIIQKQPLSTGLAILIIVAMVSFAFVYGLGLGPIPWLLIHDLMPPHLLVTATAIAASFNWLAAFILVKWFDSLAGVIGIFTGYWILGAISLAGAIYTHVVVPGGMRGATLDHKNIHDSQQRFNKSDSDISSSRM